MNGKVKQRLIGLNNSYNNGKRKSTTEPIWLFIAQMTAETNGSTRLLILITGIGITAGLGVLVALATRGF